MWMCAFINLGSIVNSKASIDDEMVNRFVIVCGMKGSYH